MDDESNCHKRVFKHKSYITASFNANRTSKSEIRLRLKSIIDHIRVFIHDEHQTERSFIDNRGQWNQTTADVDLLKILNRSYEGDLELRQLIRSELQRFNQYLQQECYRTVLNRLVFVLINKLRDFVRSITTPWDIEVVYLNLAITVEHIIYEWLLETVLPEPFEYDDDNYGLRPASKSAKAVMLKRLCLDDKNDGGGEEEEKERCTVCLEDLITDYR